MVTLVINICGLVWCNHCNATDIPNAARFP